VTTRKPHKCWGCTEEFPPGTNMRYIVSVDAGELCSSYWCLACDRLHAKYFNLLEPCEGFLFGELADLVKQEESELAEVGGDRNGTV
jgi:hypothetical protein